MMKPHARSDLGTPDLIELLSLDEAGFKKRFAGTPMLRTKRRGVLRNARGVAGERARELADRLRESLPPRKRAAATAQHHRDLLRINQGPIQALHPFADGAETEAVGGEFAVCNENIARLG
jgi:hypothetical protein